MTSPAPPVIEPDIEETTDKDRPWQVIVWDDPVNTIPYVIFVFRKLFGYSEQKATELTMRVHHEGKASVSSGPREKMEIDCYQLHSYGLWATIEQS
ncbi:MAG: ATP-dependent Clp protease adapter ClpS [Actinobacteria bacterium]|nr:MAG: ATP-dependent Clp protease adapter ClpS [Actinomycetota bacterium]